MSEYENLGAAVAAYVKRADLSAVQQQALETLLRWQDGLESNDLAALRAMMDDDIVIELPFNESGKTDRASYRRYVGVDQCCAFWTVAFEHEGKIHGISEIDLTVDGPGSRVFFECRGHLTMSSGREYRNRYVMRMDVRDGKVLSCKEYYNPIQSAYAFGRAIAGQFVLETLTPADPSTTHKNGAAAGSN